MTTPSGGRTTGGTPSGGGSTTPSGGGSTTPSGGGSTTPSGGGSTTPSGGGSTTSSGGGTTSGSRGGSSTTPSTTPSPTQDARNKGLRGGAGAAGGAVVAAATGGSALATAESLMAMATTMTSAAVILPPALMISFMFRLSTSKPQNLDKAGSDWAAAAQELEQASHDLRQLAESIPEQAWSMDDRNAYENKVGEFCLQVDALHNYLMAVSIALKILAWALFAYAVFAMGMAVYIDALAILAVASLASIVGAVDYPALLALAQTASMITNISTGVLAAAGGIAGMAMFGGASFTGDYQADHGNAGAKAAFDKAFATGSAGAAANLLQNAGNAGLSWLNRSGGQTINGGLPGGRSAGGKGFPLTEIDLDADRDINRTWTVGGGAKFETPAGETEVAGNVKKNDEGWAGGEVGVNQKTPILGGTADVTGGGKLTWDENENLAGGYKVGAGHPGSGSQTEYEGNWDNKGDYSDKYKVNTPAYNTEGSFAEGPKDETPPWDK